MLLTKTEAHKNQIEGLCSLSIYITMPPLIASLRMAFSVLPKEHSRRLLHS